MGCGHATPFLVLGVGFTILGEGVSWAANDLMVYIGVIASSIYSRCIVIFRDNGWLRVGKVLLWRIYFAVLIVTAHVLLRWCSWVWCAFLRCRWFSSCWCNCVIAIWFARVPDASYICLFQRPFRDIASSNDNCCGSRLGFCCAWLYSGWRCWLMRKSDWRDLLGWNFVVWGWLIWSRWLLRDVLPDSTLLYCCLRALVGATSTLLPFCARRSSGILYIASEYGWLIESLISRYSWMYP